MKNPSINAIYFGFLFILTFFSGSASTDTGNPSKQPLTSNTSFNIVEANPKPNSLTAPRQAEISIKFNDVINRYTVSDTSIVVYGNQTGFLKCKAANYTFAQNDSIVEFISDRQFKYGEIVSITLTPKLESATGVPLSRGVGW